VRDVKKLHANFSLARENSLNGIFWRIGNLGRHSSKAQSKCGARAER